jgi:predicted CXXCH cytochrome family protein
VRIEPALIAVGLVLPLAAVAGNWHRLENLVCSDCHTMHGSQSHAFGSASPVPTTPAPGGDWLSATAPNNHLLKAPGDQLCLACHDGTTSGAPDVIAPVGYVSDPLGGAFASASGPSDNAHDLGNPSPVVPPDGDTAVVLGCRTCHDTHGNSNYRNLRPRPSGSPLRSDVTVSVAEKIVANGSNPAQVYVASNATYKAGMSAWCRDCHNVYDEATSHPTDRQIYGATFADWNDWAARSWTTSNPNWILDRVQNPQDPAVANYQQYDQVFCLSCHKAHGSANPKAVVYADGLSIDSTCGQCHYDKY